MYADAHNDTITKAYFENKSLFENCFQFDIKRSTAIGLKLQYMAIWQDTRKEGIDFFKNIIDILGFTKTFDLNNLAFTKKFSDQKLNVVISVEDISFVNDIDMIDELKEKGIMSASLSWNHSNLLCGGALEDGNLTNLGKDVLKHLQKINFIIDFSHLGEKSFYDAIKLLDKPFIVSHSNCYSINPHPRNLKDEQIRIVKEYEGIIGINFYSNFLKNDDATIKDVIKHIAYICDLIGHRYVCFGSDFDGADKYPNGLQNIEDLANLRQMMINYGFDKDEIDDICYFNLERFTMRFLK